MSFAVFESMNHNNWSPVMPLISAPMFAPASAEVLSSTPQPSSLNLSGFHLAENQITNVPAPSDGEKELDFFAELLMDFSKGIYSAAVASDATGKRKPQEMEFGSFKKTKRMPRSPSINALVSEQTIACEEHSSKHVRCPMNCPNRRPGSKRVRTVSSEETRTAPPAAEKAEETAKTETTVQHYEPIQPLFHPSTKTYELNKPNTPEDYIQTLKWALSQLSGMRGSLEEIFNVIRKNGWKELKFGTLREMLLCKKNFQKYLETSLESVQLNNDIIFYSKELTPEFSLKDIKKASKSSKKEIPTSPSSDMSPIASPAPASPSFEQDSEEQTDETGASDKRKKGRRWLRFACEKHRREHTKCSDNCPHRKVTYTIRAGEGN
jgi:hypothetical protein